MFVLREVKYWDSPAMFLLFEKFESQIVEYNFHAILRDAMHSNLTWVTKRVSTYCEKKIEAINPMFPGRIFSEVDLDLFLEILKLDRQTGFSLILEQVLKLIQKTRFETESATYHDGAFGSKVLDQDEGHEEIEDILSLLIAQVRDLAANQDALFLWFYQTYRNHGSRTLRCVIACGFLSSPEGYISEIFEYLVATYSALGFEENGKLDYLIRKILSVTYSNFDSSQKDVIDDFLIGIVSKYELFCFLDSNNKKKFQSSWGRLKQLNIEAIPQKEIQQRPNLRTQILELRRRHKPRKDNEPFKVRMEAIVAPMSDSAYEKMTKEQWITTFKKFDSDRIPNFGTFQGGLLEHARRFEQEVTGRSIEFVELIQDLIANDSVPHDYVVHGLNGLKQSSFNPDQMLRLYKKAIRLDFDRANTLYFIWIAEYFVQHQNIDLEVLEFLITLAKTHKDPDDAEIQNDPLTHGVNHVRGAAAKIICSINFNPAFEQIIFDALDFILNDIHVSVLAVVMAFIRNLFFLNQERVLQLFLKLVSKGEPEVMKVSILPAQFLSQVYFQELRPYYEIGVEIEDLRPNIALLLFYAWLGEEAGSWELLRKATKASHHAAKKVIEGSMMNIWNTNPAIANKSKKIFELFLTSKSEEVADAYSYGFTLINPPSLPSILPSLRKYATSVVFKHEPYVYHNYLQKCANIYPKECLELIRLSDYRNRSLESTYLNENAPVKILLTAYNSLSRLNGDNGRYLEMCIELFDQFLQNPIYREKANEVIDMVDK